MDMGEIIKAPRRVQEPAVAPKVDAPLRAPMFPMPVRERELVPVGPKKEGA